MGTVIYFSISPQLVQLVMLQSCPSPPEFCLRWDSPFVTYIPGRQKQKSVTISESMYIFCVYLVEDTTWAKKQAYMEDNIKIGPKEKNWRFVNRICLAHLLCPKAKKIYKKVKRTALVPIFLRGCKNKINMRTYARFPFNTQFMQFTEKGLV